MILKNTLNYQRIPNANYSKLPRISEIYGELPLYYFSFMHIIRYQKKILRAKRDVFVAV